MEHAGTIVGIFGFFVASVVAGIVFAIKTGPIGNFLHRKKQCIIDKADKNPDNKLLQALAGPDAITFLALITGTFFVFAGQLYQLIATW